MLCLRPFMYLTMLYHHSCLRCAFPRAVGLGASGAVYFGANLEFPGNPLSQSVSAKPTMN
jgi:hypothetical protein